MTALLLGLAIAGTVAWIWQARVRGARNNFLETRPEMTVDEIYEKFYPDKIVSKETVSRALTEIASALEVPAGRLRPSDRFAKELAPPAGWENDDELGALALLTKDRLAKSKAKATVENIHTVDDYIRLLPMSD